jgi:hypothetical protein
MANGARLGFAALLPLLGALVGACVEPPGAERIIGPDGTRMLHVHCGDEQVACFQLAGELCPRGYFLSPIFDPHDGNFLVRCKDGTEASAFASTAPQAPAQPLQPAGAPIAVRARAVDEPWPPFEVAKPSEPWPAPSAGTPEPKIGDVDLGY